jgi:hypothetical protein
MLTSGMCDFLSIVEKEFTNKEGVTNRYYDVIFLDESDTIKFTVREEFYKSNLQPMNLQRLEPLFITVKLSSKTIVNEKGFANETVNSVLTAIQRPPKNNK